MMMMMMMVEFWRWWSWQWPCLGQFPAAVNRPCCGDEVGHVNDGAVQPSPLWTRRQSTRQKWRHHEVGSHLDFSLASVSARFYLEEASAHKSTVTHAGNVFVSCGLDLWPFWLQNKWIQVRVRVRVMRLVVDHACVRLGDHSCLGILDIVRKNKQTDTTEHRTHAAAVGLGDNNRCSTPTTRDHLCC